MPNRDSNRLAKGFPGAPQLGMLIGMGLGAILAALLHFSISQALGWGSCTGVLCGIALDTTRTGRERVLCGILAAGIAASAVWFFGLRAGA